MWVIAHWLVALAFLFPVVDFWAEVGDHAAISRDAPGLSRSNIGILHRLMIHTHNDGYHAVHHLWPNIPGDLLPRAHDEIVAYLREQDGGADAAHGTLVVAHSFCETLRHLRCRGSTPA
jgi:fatty acid desaturase